MVGLLGEDDPNDTGLLASNPQQLIPMSALQMGLSIMANNRPGGTTGEALGAGGMQGLGAYMQGNSAIAKQRLSQMQAQKYGLETQKLGYEVGNLKDQKTVMQQMFPELGGQGPIQMASGQSPMGGGQPAPNGMPNQSQALSGMPQGALKDPLAALGLDRDTVKSVYAYGGPEAVKNLLQTAATKRIETDQWQDVGGGMQQSRLTGEKKPISPTLVNVAVNGPQRESSFNKTLGEEQGKDAAGVYKEADAARNQLVSTQQLRQLVGEWNSSGGSQGQLAPLQAKITSYAQAVGIDPKSLGLPADAGPSQAIDAIMKKMALGNIGSNSGGLPANNFSEADRDFIVDIQPSLKDTPAGMQAKLSMVEKMAQRSVQKETMFNQMDEQGKSYSDFRRAWAKYTEQNPLLSDDEKKQIRSISGAKPSPGGRGVIDFNDLPARR